MTAATKAKTLIAYHGDVDLKKQTVAEMRAHRKADEIIQQTYWDGSRGCAVGCMTKDPQGGGRHDLYPVNWGIPEELAWLEDRIFEGLPTEKAKDWPVRFLDAIPVGADLSKVSAQFRLWCLIDPKHGVRQYSGDPAWGVAAAVDMCADVLRRRISGETGEPLETAARTARTAARTARTAARTARTTARTARTAARTAADTAAWTAAETAADTAARTAAETAADTAAWTAETAAWTAAWTAETAAWTAAETAAWTAAETAAFEAQADQLVKLLKAAPKVKV